MRINPILATAVLTAIFAIQGWSLLEIVSMKIQLARISEHLHIDDGSGAVGSNNPYQSYTSK